MEKYLYILFLVIGFGLGYLVADFKQIVPSSAPLDKHAKSPSMVVNDLQAIVASVPSPITNSATSSIKTLSEQQREQVSKIIENASEQQIDEYLNKAFPKQDFTAIQNKKLFAQRALEELSSHNDQQTLSGRLVLGRTPVMPQISEDLSQIHSNQSVFAHFDTLGKFPADEQIFIRWLNRDTGEVLMFTPRKITQDVSQNWVSAAPPTGWQIGTYDVKVYQMHDQLKPIAQASYRIVEIL
ncbi:hypothetical protein F2A31_01080 [Acinetobacter suaedae]|uniref:Uncharacterized protein n=1 Tax=Acinetobacter suaedae TaxID=2609668 RepID=A0A5P1UNU0_9GAMM|nr:hypothetical protein [Acinetobacter sp. C16S1]QER38375.1 hypothetical protein F2A31_01080 [Acinetobacter sp. C16S1]